MTTYGVSVPHEGIVMGLARLSDFALRTGLNPQALRVFPGSRHVTDLNPVINALKVYPNAAIVYNPKITGKSYALDDYRKFAESLKPIVAGMKRPLYLIPDAECDRPDRPYSVAAFCDEYTRFRQTVIKICPEVQIDLCITGYQFSSRIAQFDIIRGSYSILTIDPYWTKNANAIQATDADIKAVELWARRYRKQIAFGEWGAEAGDGQADRVRKGIEACRKLGVVYATYFQESDPNIARWPTALSDDSAYNEYRRGIVN